MSKPAAQYTKSTVNTSDFLLVRHAETTINRTVSGESYSLCMLNNGGILNSVAQLMLWILIKSVTF